MLPARSKTDVIFDAYCADFELENPMAGDTFIIAALPSNIADIIARISRFAADNLDGDYDYTTAMQLALWRTQGNTKAGIAEKFVFDEEDWEISTKIMNYK